MNKLIHTLALAFILVSCSNLKKDSTPAKVISTPELAESKPKYGPKAVRLSKSHVFFRESDAPDYWALAPYYAAQMTESTCSVASLTMALNALRSKQDLGSEEELVTEPALLSLTEGERKSLSIRPEKAGVTLDQLKIFAEIGLKAYGFTEFKVEMVRVSDKSSDTKQKLIKDFTENERSAKTMIIANFLQGTLTGDAPVGHVAPIGAFDPARNRALVMDPDRKWYEPYWVSVDSLLEAMTEQDAVSQKARGYIKIKVDR